MLGLPAMKQPFKILCFTILALAPLFLFLKGSFGEIASQKKADPFTREECRYCHKGPQQNQIDDSKGPWCVPCHTMHNVGTTLGLKTYFNQRIRTAENNPNQSVEETIILQKMILIPAGEFIMGEDFAKKSLGPRHTVYLSDYYIDQYHVTNFYYQTFVNETHHAPPPNWIEGRFQKGQGNHPVSFVDWFDAAAYCNWTGKRLPTEAEWEKAARGSDGRMFPWGPHYLKGHANVQQEGIKSTTAVNLYPEGKSPYGLYDMAGNLFQWTSDWFLPYPGNTIPHPNFGRTLRVLRGGSFYDCTNYRCGISFQTFNRISLLPQTRAISAGFRCVKSAGLDEEKLKDR